MSKFEKRLLDMIENIKFRSINCRFQRQISTDIQSTIRKSDKVLIAADKTTNFYKTDVHTYEDLLQKNITKHYKKITPDTTSAIEMKNKQIAEKLQLDDRIRVTAKREAFITLKDHKPNFENSPTCRLINPSKSEIGKISKQMLDRINCELANKLKLNQWKNTSAVLKWFNTFEHKEKCSFIAFDVIEFYPSISVDLLNSALDFASKHCSITADQREIILHAKESCLYQSGEPWSKKCSSNLFDVTMGSFDGAETCELVGMFLLQVISQKHGQQFGLYRDDGLGIIDESPRQTEMIKKDLCSIFRKYGLRITIEANKKVVNFLDVTLNITTGQHKPYNKPNNTPLYVNVKSNHPPSIIRNIPIGINKRLNEISSDAAAFNDAAPMYQEALKASGYNQQLKFTESENPPKQRSRHRKIIWYNPPYSKSVTTNIGKLFLKFLDEEFPRTHKLYKIFNRNTIKISYSCMDNVKHHIDGHNKSILSNRKETNPATEQELCNCRIRNECPVSGRCLTDGAIYQATVSTDNDREVKTYIGLTENTFKTRYANHKASFKHKKLSNSTELSKYIWNLKERQIDYRINWKIIRKATPYNPASNRCNLCLWEKFYIICKPTMASLNKRNELVSTCRHASKYLLQRYEQLANSN